MVTNTDKISSTQILVPMGVMALSLVMLFAFQTNQVLKERDTLQQNLTKLDAPLEQSQKLNAQFGGLVVGTQKLAGEGNAIAKDFVGRLKKIGVIMEPKTEALPSEAPVQAPPGMVPANMKPVAAPPGMVPAGMKPMMAPVPAAQDVPAKGPVKP
jgi:hypothetical protein